MLTTRLLASGAAVLLLTVAATGCADSSAGADRPSYRSSYDRATGRLALITADRNGDGRVDAWTYMDGSRVVRAELDDDFDGLVDRWEWYDAQAKLTEVGLSTKRDGICNLWEYPDASGRLVRSEEDTNGDGKPDKWETYAGGAVRTAEFDDDGDGVPDRRLTYDALGHLVSVETGPDGHGGYRDRKAVK